MMSIYNLYTLDLGIHFRFGNGLLCPFDSRDNWISSKYMQYISMMGLVVTLGDCVFQFAIVKDDCPFTKLKVRIVIMHSCHQ